MASKKLFDRLERTARQSFREHCLALAKNHLNTGNWRPSILISEPSISRKEHENGALELFCHVEINPVLATANNDLKKIGQILGERELFCRMLDICREIDFPVLDEIRAGTELSFQEAWEKCAEHAENNEKSFLWLEMPQKLLEKAGQTHYLTWTRVIFDPALPMDRQIVVESSFSVVSPFLTPEEDKNGKMLPFSEWFRGKSN